MRHFTSALALLLVSSPALAEGGNFWLYTGLHAVNFILLVFILVRMAGPKIKEAMQSRSDTLSKEITSAEERFAEAESQLALYEGKLKALEKDSQDLLNEYRELGERERGRIREQAQKDADRIINEAKMLAAREIENARLSIEKEVVNSALAKAETEIRSRLTADDKQRLVSGYFTDLERVIGTDSGESAKQETT